MRTNANILKGLRFSVFDLDAEHTGTIKKNFKEKYLKC